MVHYCQINLTEKNIIAASRPQSLYKAGAKAENSHIDVQKLENCAVTVVQLPKVDPENFTSDKFRGVTTPVTPPFAYGPDVSTAP